MRRVWFMRLGLGRADDSLLAQRLAALTAVRLVVLTLFLALSERVYFRDVGLSGFSGRMALATTGIAYGLAALYAVVLRVGRGLRGLAHAQLVTDQIIWTAIAYLSGGVTSGATALYGLTCLSGAIMLYQPGALSAALAAIGSYLSMCVGFGKGWISPPADQAASAYIVHPSDMVYPALGTVMTTVVVTLLAAHLADRLRAAGSRLEDATRRAEQAEQLAALGQLAAALAHEIRNPLGSIRASMELLRSGGQLGDEDSRLCQIVEREVARVDDLVGDMLHLGRPRPPELAEVDLAATAASVVELARQRARPEQGPVRYEGAESMLVLADANQMRQVLWNLVRNAIQASPPGKEVVVRLTQDDADGAAELQVLDAGPGIPAEEQARIFDAFYTKRAHGMGIGLAVVKQIADAHGFDLRLQTQTGRGTTFAVRIPCQRMVAAAALASALVLGCASHGRWIDPAPAAPEVLAADDEWPPGAGPVASARPEPAPADSAALSAPEPGPPGASQSTAISLEGGGRAGSTKAAPLGPAASTEDLFRNTYYDFPQEVASAAGPTETLFDLECKPLRKVAKSFHDQLCVQGSGRLASGESVSFGKRDCACAAICPRTGQRICFELLDPARFPYGRGSMGTAITPLRTVAVDPSVIPLGTVMYIPEFHGLRDLSGAPHDGCFVAEDRGLKVQGRHVDLFTGLTAVTKAWNAAVPSNRGVRVILDATRCAALRREPKPH